MVLVKHCLFHSLTCIPDVVLKCVCKVSYCDVDIL